MDFYTDQGNTLLRAICKIKQPPEFVKSAAVIEKESIPDHMFALPEKRAFSCADPASTYVSFGYWLMNNNQMHDSESTRTKESLVKAGEFYGITGEMLDLAKKYKEAKDSIKEKRAEQNYGLPKTKEYPLHTEAHVVKAAELFPEHHVKYSIPQRAQIAQKIVKKANQFNIPIHTEIIVKYASLPETVCRSDQAAVNVSARGLYTDNLEAKQLFHKLGKSMIGHMDNTDTLTKVANVLGMLDRHYGLDDMYTSGKMLDPISTVFNLHEKQALETLKNKPININGESYNLKDLASIPADYYAEALGDDFAEAISSPGGNIDTNKLESIIPTLPLPEKNILIRYLKQYSTQKDQNVNSDLM